MKIIRKYSKEALWTKEYVQKIKSVGKKNYRYFRLHRFLSQGVYLWILVAVAIVVLFQKQASFPGKTAVSVVIGIGAFLGLTIPYYLLLNKAFPHETVKQVTTAFVTEFTAPLRAHYGLGADFVVTKCYTCTKSVFDKKDVILFFHGDEVRIMVDLFRSTHDLGCIVIPKQELTFSNAQRDGRVCTVIACPKFEMVLGYRAGTFLRKGPTDAQA